MNTCIILPPLNKAPGYVLGFFMALLYPFHFSQRTYKTLIGERLFKPSFRHLFGPTKNCTVTNHYNKLNKNKNFFIFIFSKCMPLVFTNNATGQVVCFFMVLLYLFHFSQTDGLNYPVDGPPLGSSICYVKDL